MKTTVLSCENMRCDAHSAYHPVGSPYMTDQNVGRLLLAFTAPSGKVYVIGCRDNGAVVAACDGRAIDIGTLASGTAAACAVECGNEVVIMPGADGGVPESMIFDADNNRWRWNGPVPDLESIGITRQDAKLISVTLPARQLEGDYSSRSEQLAPVDRNALTTELTAAYCEICDQASWERTHVQPVMARYRLIGHKGEIIYESCPKLVTASAGVQCHGLEATWALNGSTASIGGATLSARSFRVVLKMPPVLSAAFQASVREVQLLVSPQLHPVSFSGQCLSSVANGFIKVMMPGVPVAGTSQIASRGSSFYHRIMAALWGLKEVLRVSDDGYNAMWPTTAAQVTGIEKLVERGCTIPANNEICRLMPPHSFTAATVTKSGNTLVWGNVKSRLYDGYRPHELAMTYQTLAKQQTGARITLSDGETLVCREKEQGVTSASFSPLMVYPDPRVATLELYVDDKYDQVDLFPSPDGLWAVGLRPDCKPWNLGETVASFALPQATSQPLSLPQAIVVCRVGNPQRAVSASLTGTGTIMALAPASRSRSAWDFGRAHFYAFSTAGVHSLQVSRDLRELSLAVIDPRPVVGGNAITSTSQGVAALAGGDLVMIAGSSATTLAPCPGGKRLGWCERWNELWVKTAGQIRVYNSQGKMVMTRSDVDPMQFLNMGGTLWATNLTGELMDLGAEQSSSPTVSLTFQTDYLQPIKLKPLLLPVYGTVSNLKIDARGGDTPGLDKSPVLSSFTVNGKIDAPLRLMVRWPYHRFLTVTMAGSLSSGGKICPFQTLSS